MNLKIFTLKLPADTSLEHNLVHFVDTRVKSMFHYVLHDN